jgi:hypothetical protein
MRNLQSYVTARNRFNSIFGSQPLEIGRDNQKIANMIDSELSPENLTCDGELSRSAVQKRYRELTAAARELKQLDPSVTFYEYA